MLKSLELFGFKSFVERTRFDFAAGITGVVGPNGSGKSNVVDALKWVLGDQSPKSMRGKEMTDVIFKGASGRKASGYAEATLTFDNTAEHLPIDSAEIQINRRIWRNGDAEYRINGTIARLKDIRNLFLGTGVGSSAYSIIEQGRVGEILQANATARRLVFEEAAGISRYKARKTEALRKLDRVAQNLLRLTDIVDEVEARLTATRDQASKATRFREASNRQIRWWNGLSADDHRRHKANLEELDRVIAGYQEQVDGVARGQQEFEESLGTVDAEIAELDDRLRTAGDQRTGHREEMARHEATLRHLRTRVDEYDQDRIGLDRQCRLLEQRLREATSELETASAEVAGFESRADQAAEAVAARNSERGEIDDQLGGLKLQLEEHRRETLQQTQTLAARRQRTQELEAQAESFANEDRDSGATVEALESERAAGRDRLADRQRELERRGGVRDAAKAAVVEVHRRQHELKGEHQQFVGELAELREQRSARQARAEVLNEFERREAGLGIGVREILKRAGSARRPPWNRIRGSVADLLDVSLDRAALVEAALGERATWIVLDELAPLADYLQTATDRFSDRVGFIAGDSTPASSPPPAELDGQPGVIGPASLGVCAAGDVDWLVERLLGNTWIVESLDVARRLAAAEPGSRFVTLQGELLESDGTLFAGTVQAESSPLSRKSELRQLQQDLDSLNERIAASETRLRDLDASLGDIDGEHKAGVAERDQADRGVREAEAGVDEQRRELERIAKDHQDVLGRRRQLEMARVRHAEDLEATSRELDAAETSLATLEELITTGETSIEQLGRQREELEQLLGRMQQALAKQEERRDGHRAAHDRMRRDVSQRREQQAEALRRIGELADQLRDVTLRTLNTRGRLAELVLAEEQQALAVTELLTDKDNHRQRRTTLATDESQLREQRRALQDQQHEEQTKAQEIRHQLGTLEERLAEEYQLDFDSLEQSGVSAFELYLAELHGGPSVTDDESEAAQPGESEPDDDDGSAGEEPADTEITPPPGVSFESVREELEQRVSRLRRKLKMMGSVNTDSLNDLDELEQRFEHLDAHRRDLVEAKATLEAIVARINVESRRIFLESFASIRKHFQELFRTLFGGGDGDVILEDLDDVLDCGIEIVARPPGKELRRISLLSGGEQTMTAVALLMAMFKSRPSPFCILDEVDAALDDTNIDRYSAMLSEFASSTQFIMISHNKLTMQVADVLYGVTMEQPGISKRISVRFEDVHGDGGVSAP